ncbi:MAG: DNA primase [Bacteroidaceae bacterium]|nr:DNA primase [Bacteroidaceae bacterium]MCF0185396.1 DNA primase [Bacteroidaceae bacterium]
MIDQATKQRILDAAQIVDIVSDFVNLKKAGVNYVGLCPFHSDKSPSLTVSPAKGLYKCFACGNGGGPVKFVMEIEQMTYPEALKWLARKYHIEVHERELTDDEKQEQSDKESMMVVTEWACQYFEHILENDVDGRALGMAYLRSRGFRDDIIHKFRLGYSPADRYALCNEAKKKGFEDRFLTGSGVCYAMNDGRLHDRFYGRVIFPFFTVSGRIVGFGGRKLDSRTKGVEQKYVNSPESPIYDKSRTLYGLFQAKQSIVRENRCLMVEGYTDVLSLHQSGVENVVASSGTSLTIGQIQLLHRFTSNVTLLYDGDAAGMKATEKGSDLLLQEGMNVKILILPQDEDPDSFCRKHSAQEVQDYIRDNQMDFIHFRINRMMKEIAGDPLRKSELIKTIIQSISLIPDEITRSVYMKESADALNVEERMLVKGVAQVRQKRREEKNKNSAPETAKESSGPSKLPEDVPFPEEERPPFPPVPPEDEPAVTVSSNPYHETETLIIRELILHGEQKAAEGEDEHGDAVAINVADFIHYCMEEDNMQFHTLLYNRVLEEVRTRLQETPTLRIEPYLLSHPDIAIADLAAELATEKYTVSKLYEVMDKGKESPNESIDKELVSRLLHLINDLKLRIIETEWKETQAKLLDPAIQSDSEQSAALLSKLQELTNLRKLLAKEAGDRVFTKF